MKKIKATATVNELTINKLDTNSIEVLDKAGKPVQNTMKSLKQIATSASLEFDYKKINTRSLGSKLINHFNQKPATQAKAKPVKQTKAKPVEAAPKKKFLANDHDGKAVHVGDSIGWKDDRETCGIAISYSKGEFKVEKEDDMTNEITFDWVDRTRVWSEEP